MTGNVTGNASGSSGSCTGNAAGLSSTLVVGSGGTGATSLTANGVLIGNGTSAVTAVDMSTKGHLLVGDGSGNPSTLSVGTNNYVLTADSGETTGLKWAEASGGGTSWQSVKTGDYTASSGEGVFANTSSSAWTLTLPSSPSIGDEVSFKDYASSFHTYNLTIGRNGKPIEGVAENLVVSVKGAGNTLVFTDDTKGWLIKNK